MILRVLGCSGSEAPNAHPCSFIVGDQLVIDMGSAASLLSVRQQCAIRDVVLSHAHLDHVKDLPFLIENVFQRIDHPIRIWGTTATLDKVRNHIFNQQIWPDFASLPTCDDPMLEYRALEPKHSVTIGDVDVLPVPVNHPGGCVGFLLQSTTGTLVYSGDTGPTEELWDEVRRATRVTGLLIETSFPDRLSHLADLSGHLTPALLERELSKCGLADVPVYVYHIKEPTRTETMRELRDLQNPRIQILLPGMEIRF